jgi:hypothetical protein
MTLLPGGSQSIHSEQHAFRVPVRRHTYDESLTDVDEEEEEEEEVKVKEEEEEGDDEDKGGSRDAPADSSSSHAHAIDMDTYMSASTSALAAAQVARASSVTIDVRAIDTTQHLAPSQQEGGGVQSARNSTGKGLHSSTYQLNISTFSGNVE